MRLFADTSFYVAIVSSKDTSHVVATGIIKEFKGRIVTTEYVLVEVGNWLASSGDRSSFIKLNQQAFSAGCLHVNVIVGVCGCQKRFLLGGAVALLALVQREFAAVPCDIGAVAHPVAAVDV